MKLLLNTEYRKLVTNTNISHVCMSNADIPDNRQNNQETAIYFAALFIYECQWSTVYFI